MDKITDEEFTKIIRESKIWCEVLRKCNYRSFIYKKIIIERTKKLNISIHHLSNNVPRPRYTLNEILIENSNYLATHELKKRIIKELGWKRECSNCKLSKWMDKEIPIDLDHINGDHFDNRIENLRLLCPNCHAKTSTYKGKNIKQFVKQIKKCIDCGGDRSDKCERCKKCAEIYIGIKNRKIVDRPSKETLLNEISTLGYAGTGRKYGVVGSTIKNWVK